MCPAAIAETPSDKTLEKDSRRAALAAADPTREASI
jgi:hypothetical protein